MLIISIIIIIFSNTVLLRHLILILLKPVYFFFIYLLIIFYITLCYGIFSIDIYILIFLILALIYLILALVLYILNIFFSWLYFSFWRCLVIFFFFLNYFLAICYFDINTLYFIPTKLRPFIFICSIIYLVLVVKSINKNNKGNFYQYIYPYISGKKGLINLILLILVLTFFTIFNFNFSIYNIFTYLIIAWVCQLIGKININLIKIYINNKNNKIKVEKLKIKNYYFIIQKTILSCLTWQDFLYITSRVIIIYIFKWILTILKLILTM